MTDEEKIALIMKSPYLLESDLTAEEHNFLYGHRGKDITAEEKRLWFIAWQRTPNTIEHAAATIDPEELAIAVKVLRTIRERWIAAGLPDKREFDRETTAGHLIEILEQTAAEAERG